jgi:hypothetical protein
MIARITWDDKTSIIVPGITVWYDHPPPLFTQVNLKSWTYFFLLFFFFILYTGTEIS